MTNREYMESLSNEELAYYIWETHPWAEYCFAEAEQYEEESDAVWSKACYDAFARWLYQEKE